MDVLAVAGDVGHAEEVEPGAEEEGEFLDPDERRCEDVAQHHLDEHQAGETETEHDDEEVEAPFEGGLDRDEASHPRIRERALRYRGEVRGRLGRGKLGVVDERCRPHGRMGALFGLPVHVRVVRSVDRPGAPAPGLRSAGRAIPRPRWPGSCP